MKKLNNITGIILFIVIAFCSCKVMGQKKPHKHGKPLTGKQINATTSPVGLSNPTIIYSGQPTSAGSYTTVADFTHTIPTNAGSYTVVPNIGYNVLSPTFKPADDHSIIKKYLLPSLPYVAIALSILLAIFLFNRNRDEVITLPDEYLNEQL